MRIKNGCSGNEGNPAATEDVLQESTQNKAQKLKTTYIRFDVRCVHRLYVLDI
jgi:hypothetical protein